MGYVNREELGVAKNKRKQLQLCGDRSLSPGRPAAADVSRGGTRLTPL